MRKITENKPKPIVTMVVAGLVVVAVLVFLATNPNRSVSLTMKSPDGKTISMDVKDSDNLLSVIQRGLDDPRTSRQVALALYGVIEGQTVDSEIGARLQQLAVNRRGPFNYLSVPAKLIVDANMPEGFASVCEGSRFASKPISVRFHLKDVNNDRTIIAYADARNSIPCAAGQEVVRVHPGAPLDLQSVDDVHIKPTL